MVIERICDKEIWRVTCPLSSRSETVRDAAVVRAGISQRLNALEHIVLLTHGFIVPAISTKEVEVGSVKAEMTYSVFTMHYTWFRMKGA